MNTISSLNRVFLYIGLILANVFLSSCSSQNKAEAFLKKILLEEGGVYTLLGDKPITDLLIYVGNEQDISLDGLSTQLIQRIEFIDDHTLENWRCWKRFSKDMKFNNFRFIERPCLFDPSHTMYLLVNKHKLAEVLQKNYKKFSVETNLDFEIDQVLNELDDSESVFWNRVFANHYLSGLVHGYGEENCRYFVETINDDENPDFSERFSGPISEKNFPLPIFALSKNDETTKKYQQQRENIQQIYKNGNFLKKTLEILKK